ncbi:asparagine synthase (glutamine-hydrolyzing) [Prosthecobacter dejongeii]|uniref:asparagine synthase (glutamine-hydrolyzing) n=1 Tax=Prosthecobacter dejongeii TaxID=48465 RepID=A0A7W7YI11_9BACT|nr:asparagine synthase (glutamine-hydrolyzing) [Prosthecobacter dejongeii]MBB5036566.1 asparagine synthase (glutamine-hydrolyzing) [Prosthecobacter dejongeii]
MCAIAGIIAPHLETEVAAEKLQTMLRRMRHRGPDGSGIQRRPNCVLGANRLAQVDAFGGQQPMSSPDGRWTLVFNGEIHNHRTLRQDLAEHWPFITQSDTEVLLAALVTWGEQALRRLNGMFAFFLWDTQKNEGLAGRDRLGVKPFVWMPYADGLAFASEAKALIEILPGRPQIHAKAVLEYFVAPCFSGVAEPMFAGMYHLPPGHLLSLREGRMEQRAWWRYDLRRSVNEDAESLQQTLHDLLPRTVARTLDTDTRAAVFLSGGLDSTLLAACAKSHNVTCGYTIVFEGQPHFDYAKALMVKSDDVPFAAEAAREIGLNHHLVPVSRATLADDLRTLAIQNDALPAWEQELAQHHLARAVSTQYRAVLVGDAADETHYGYGFMLDDISICGPAILLCRFGSPKLNPSMEGAALDLIHHYSHLMTEAGHGNNNRADRLRGITHLIVQRWLPRLLHNGDIHTMAHGLEARVPFADAELLELAVQIHPDLALHGGMEKSLLRRAAKGLMPETARVRRKSSLSKDDACTRIYQQEAQKALDASSQLLSHWLDLQALRQLCHPAYTPTEMERALLFRVICFHHWATAYHVREP